MQLSSQTDERFWIDLHILDVQSKQASERDEL